MQRLLYIKKKKKLRSVLAKVLVQLIYAAHLCIRTFCYDSDFKQWPVIWKWHGMNSFMNWILLFSLFFFVHLLRLFSALSVLCKFAHATTITRIHSMLCNTVQQCASLRSEKSCNKKKKIELSDYKKIKRRPSVCLQAQDPQVCENRSCRHMTGSRGMMFFICGKWEMTGPSDLMISRWKCRKCVGSADCVTRSSTYMQHDFLLLDAQEVAKCGDTSAPRWRMTSVVLCCPRGVKRHTLLCGLWSSNSLRCKQILLWSYEV